MTIDEAETKCLELAKINLDIWHAKTSTEKNNLKDQFRSCWMNIVSNGYKIIRLKEYVSSSDSTRPVFKIRKDKSANFIEIKDNRGEGNHHGDCTTRAISFCTGIDYSTIQKEQFANAKAYNAYGVTWRTERIWSKSLTSRGFCKIVLPKHTSGKVFLKKLEKHNINTGIIAAVSSRHIAAIDMKTRKILDVWNSAGCRIISIYVPKSQNDEWIHTINLMYNS